MAKPRMDLSAFVGRLLEEQDGVVLREGVRVLSQALMESEVAGLIGAERHKRTTYRSGTRSRTWDTRVGTIELAIPKVRPGAYVPSLLHPRRRAEQALLAVENRKRACMGYRPATWTRLFRTRPLAEEYPYLWPRCDVSRGPIRGPRGEPSDRRGDRRHGDG